MNDDLERILNGLTPRGAPVELRSRVLGAVAVELAATPPSPLRAARWDLHVALSVAALLLVAVVLNVWVIRSDDARQARLYGSRPLPREIQELVEMAERAAGPACGELVRQQLVAAWQSRPPSQPLDMRRYQQQLRELLSLGKGLIDVEEDSQVDRYHPGRIDRSASDRQCCFRLA